MDEDKLPSYSSVVHLPALHPQQDDYSDGSRTNISRSSTITDLEHHRFRIWTLTWGVLVVHFFLVTSGAWLLLRFIDQSLFPLQRMPRRPSQTDVNTILSAVLRLLSISASYISASNCWKAAYILLEKQGATMKEFNFIVSWHVPNISALRKGYGIVLMIILCASIPVQLVSPFAGGSITWIPSTELAGNFSSLRVPQAGDGYQWQWYFQFESTRHTLVQQAAGRAASMFNTTGDEADGMRRWVPAISTLPVDSVVSNITVPFMQIDSFEFLKASNTSAEFDQTLQPIITNLFGGTLNISSPYNPLQQDTAGNSALLKDYPLKNTFYTENIRPAFPSTPDSLYNTRDYYVAVLLDKITTSTEKCPGASRVFGDLPDDLAFTTVKFGNDRTSCYVVAKIRFTAGAALCANCKIVAPGVIEGYTRGGPLNLTLTLRPEPLAETIFATMPEVMQIMAMSNNSLVPPYNNLEGYTKAMVRRAYIATWTQFNEFFVPFEQSNAWLKTTTRSSRTVLEAFVSKRRIALYLAAHALLIIAAGAVLILQGQCQSGMVVDPVGVTLMVDVSEVLPETGSSGAIGVVSERYSDEIGRMKLVRRRGQGYKLVKSV